MVEAVPLRQRDSRISRSLEAVVLKSLSKRPGDRYASAGALAADVECYLADEPVSVLSDPLLSRLGRWSRRHRGLVVTAGVSLLLVTGLSVVAAVVIEGQRQQVAESRKVAVENEQSATVQEALAKENRDAALSTIEMYLGAEMRARLGGKPGLQKVQKQLDQAAKVAARLKAVTEQLAKLQPNAPTVRRMIANAEYIHQLARSVSEDYNTVVEAVYGELRTTPRLPGPRRLQQATMLALCSGTAKADSVLSAMQRENVSARLADDRLKQLILIRPAFRMPRVRKQLDTWQFAPLRQRKAFREFRLSVEPGGV